jgi:uncharacterized protein YktB (UPF0637 family)
MLKYRQSKNAFIGVVIFTMEFTGFSEEDFQVFSIAGLEERMNAIKDRIQPKFREIGTYLTAELSAMVGNEMFLHIAKHARRKVNPPKDTWLAIGPNKRGYKQFPHFQVGLFDDHVFLWLAYIYELPNKAQIADNLLNHMNEIKQLISNDFVVSTDHMNKNANSVQEIDLEATLLRFKQVKKAEFLLGRNIAKNDPILNNGKQFLELATSTFKTLVPIYQMSYR